MEYMEGDLLHLAERVKNMVLTDDQRYGWLMFIVLFMIYDLYYMHSNG